MPFLFAIFSLILGAHRVSASPTVDFFQDDIDSAFQEIMQTHTGKAICQQILGAQADAIEFHLGVSHVAAETIAQSCVGEPANSWIYATSYQDIRKLTAKAFVGRKYQLLSADTTFPIESWTDPISNVTVLLSGREGISHERLVQLLAHELGVYFDSKANPANADAQYIPELSGLQLQTDSSGMDPLVAISNPLTAHTMTFVRALQVEYSIVNELIQMRKIVPPADHFDPYLNYLISDQCGESCLEHAITQLRQQTYLPIGLPLLAFAPYYRALLNRTLLTMDSNWTDAQRERANQALNVLPNEFLKTQFTGDPLADMQRIFTSSPTLQPAFQAAAQFLNNDLWPIEWPALTQTHVSQGKTLLEYMKVPLLSGYNILLSSGPRVRVRTGTIE